MRPSERREAILALARAGDALKVGEIADRFGVSRETIRRDLARLDEGGLLKRVHGGAQPSRTAAEPPSREGPEAKAVELQRIARAAAALFQPGDTLMIGTGSTTQAFAAALAPSQKLTVITNSISVAIELHRGASSNRVYVTGGEYRGEAGAMFGSVAVDHIGQFRAEHAVLTIGAVDIAGGFMDFDVEEAMVARAMIAQAEHVTILADHAKLGRAAMAKVCQLNDVTRLVTDRAPSPAVEEALQRNGVHVVIAS